MPVAAIDQLLKRYIMRFSIGSGKLCEYPPVSAKSVIDIADKIVSIGMGAIVKTVPAIFIAELFIYPSFDGSIAIDAILLF